MTATENAKEMFSSYYSAITYRWGFEKDSDNRPHLVALYSEEMTRCAAADTRFAQAETPEPVRWE